MAHPDVALAISQMPIAMTLPLEKGGNKKALGGWSPGCFFSDYLLSRTGGCQYPNKTGVGCFIFTIAASIFFSMHLTAATCLNSRLLAVWCLKRKAGPIRKVKIYGCICCLMIIMWGMVNSSVKK